MICAEKSVPTDRKRLIDRPGPVSEPVRYRTVAGAALVVLGRAHNRQTAARSNEGWRVGGFRCRFFQGVFR